jgi:hypothetical protein
MIVFDATLSGVKSPYVVFDATPYGVKSPYVVFDATLYGVKSTYRGWLPAYLNKPAVNGDFPVFITFVEN